MLPDGRSWQVGVTGASTAAHLLALVGDRLGGCPDHWNVVHQAQRIAKHRTLASGGVSDGTRLDIVPDVLAAGGERHGRGSGSLTAEAALHLRIRVKNDATWPPLPRTMRSTDAAPLQDPIQVLVKPSAPHARRPAAQ